MREILFRGKCRDTTFKRVEDVLMRREEHNEEWFRHAKKELDRIKAAKADIIWAIRAKGGEVPEGTRIDELGACIMSIPTPEEAGEYE